MEFTQADLNLISVALGSRMDELKIRLRLGDKDAVKEAKIVKELADRLETEIRETSLPIGRDRYTVDSDGMPWA